MAEIFDPFKAAPEAPSIADPFAPGYKPPETGFVPTMKRTAGQMLTGLATAAEDVGLGDNAITQGLRNYGQGVIDRNPAGINSLSDVVAHPWETVKESLGQVAPQMATGILGRMAGGALGGAIAGPPGAAIGGLLGAVAPIFTQEYGGIRDYQKQSGTEDKGKALAAAAGATAIDFLGGPESRLIRKGVTPLAEKAGSSALKDYATAIGKGVATEGAQEGVQNVIEQLGASRNPTEAGSLEDTALASIMGGIGGGVRGPGATRRRSHHGTDWACCGYGAGDGGCAGTAADCITAGSGGSGYGRHQCTRWNRYRHHLREGERTTIAVRFIRQPSGVRKPA